MRTPKTSTSNDPQKVMKTIAPKEEITINVTKEVSGEDLFLILNGVMEFTKVFIKSDKYKLELKVIKTMDETKESAVIVDGESKQQSD